MTVTESTEEKDEHLLLVVDDDMVARDILTRMLRSLGYVVKALASGEEAVEYLRQNQVRLILLDMVMAPGISGRETYERILAFKPGQQAIVVSGFATSDEIMRIFQLGVSQILQKPYTMEKLESVIKTALNDGDVST